MFWQRFYNLCEQNNSKPNSVAKNLGFSTATCTHWKDGAVPKADAVVKIADYFNVSVDYLLGRTDYPHFGQQKNELIALINQLTPAEQDKVIAFYRLLKDEQTPPQQQ